jgi:hypothetical protein
MKRSTATVLLLIAIMTVPVVASATDLLLPAFAHQVRGHDGAIWSSELYLTNPGDQPVQVTLNDFLGDTIDRPAPCNLFMTPTRVVPPRSSVVWTAAGLATDLGCAEAALGALELRADGAVQITSRLVRREAEDGGATDGLLLTGRGQEFEAVPVADLPRRGEVLMLPALLWHRNPCGPPAFDTTLGFANPTDRDLVVLLTLERDLAAEGIRVDGRRVNIPHQIVVPARGWIQVRIEPEDVPGAACLPPEGFAARVRVTGPVAVYASVVDRRSHDPRTVMPVPLDPSTAPADR